MKPIFATLALSAALSGCGTMNARSDHILGSTARAISGCITPKTSESFQMNASYFQYIKERLSFDEKVFQDEDCKFGDQEYMFNLRKVNWQVNNFVKRPKVPTGETVFLIPKTREMTDSEIYGALEYIAGTKDVVEKGNGMGDCDDRVAVLFEVLIASGIDPRQIYYGITQYKGYKPQIVSGQLTEDGTHAVIVIYPKAITPNMTVEDIAKLNPIIVDSNLPEPFYLNNHNWFALMKTYAMDPRIFMNSTSKGMIPPQAYGIRYATTDDPKTQKLTKIPNGMIYNRTKPELRDYILRFISYAAR